MTKLAASPAVAEVVSSPRAVLWLAQMAAALEGTARLRSASMQSVLTVGRTRHHPAREARGLPLPCCRGATLPRGESSSHSNAARRLSSLAVCCAATDWALEDVSPERLFVGCCTRYSVGVSTGVGGWWPPVRGLLVGRPTSRPRTRHSVPAPDLILADGIDSVTVDRLLETGIPLPSPATW